MIDETSSHPDHTVADSDIEVDHEVEVPAEAEAEVETDTRLDDARDVLEESRRRVAEVPAEVVITNHVMGLYELAAIHLGTQPPDLGQAALAIDAVGCLVEGLGERLGPEAETLAVALSNIRIAFVQIKGASAG